MVANAVLSSLVVFWSGAEKGLGLSLWCHCLCPRLEIGAEIVPPLLLVLQGTYSRILYLTFSSHKFYIIFDLLHYCRDIGTATQ